MGINLHDTVRDAITSIYPDEQVQYYFSLGQTKVKGRTGSRYSEPVTIFAQIQPIAPGDLQYVNNYEQVTVERHMYIYSRDSWDQLQNTLVRHAERTGDYVYRPKYGTWWMAQALPEDYAGVEWVKLKIRYQTILPDFSFSDWYQNGD